MPSEALPRSPLNSPHTPRTSDVNFLFVGLGADIPRSISAPEPPSNSQVWNPAPLSDFISVSHPRERTTDPRQRPNASKSQQSNDIPGSSLPAHLQITGGADILLKHYENIEARIKARYQQQYDRYRHETAAWKRELEERRKEVEAKCETLHEQVLSGVKIRSEERGKWEQERKQLLRRIENLEECPVERDKAGANASLERDIRALRETVEKERNATELERKSSAEEILRYKNMNIALKETVKRQKEIWEVESKEIMKVLEKEKQASVEQNRQACLIEHEHERKKWQKEKMNMVGRLKEERKAREGLVATLNLRRRDEQGREELPRKRKRLD